MLSNPWRSPSPIYPDLISGRDRQIPALEREAEIASFAHERLDGSGYFRGAAGNAIPMEARILGTVVAWVELRSARPWRKALSGSEAVAQLTKEAKIGLFDPNIVEYVGSATLADRQPRRRRSNTIRLSSRETEVLHRISLGASNKEVARDLDLSPSTVRTHVESVFRKLECSTRAAATLKASSMGLLPSEPTDLGLQRDFLSFRPFHLNRGGPVPELDSFKCN